jgi:peptidyl-dipeptidase A
MLAMGQSRPWPEALKALTGETQLDASAMIEYFAPLKKWLDDQNQGHPVGWGGSGRAAAVQVPHLGND